MPDQPQSDRYKAEMPQIPSVPTEGSRRPGAPANPVGRLIWGLLVVVVLCLLGSRWLFHSKHTDAPAAGAPPQLEVPAPAADAVPVVPHATGTNPEIATLSEMTKPWSSKDFFFVNHFTGENTPSLLIRLPTGPAARPEGYWALAMKAPFGNCQLEYVKDVARLKNEYDFQAAKHPMIGNPCSRTVFDPLKMINIPGNIWVRGSIAQGSDLRPPLGIQIEIKGKNILALQME